MRHIAALVLMGVFFAAPASAVGADHPVRAAATREAARTRLQPSLGGHGHASRSSPQRRGGHPVLIGAAIGAAVGTVWGGISSTCTPTSGQINTAPCGSRATAEGALLGGAIGAGVGALVIYAVQAYKR